MTAVGEWPVVDRLVVDWLKAYLTGIPANSIGIFYPRSSTEEAPKIPYVQVAWDSTTDNDSFNTNAGVNFAVVRITVWGAETAQTATKQLAAKAQAVLLAHDGSGAVRKVVSNTGIFVTRDPDTEKFLASFTVRVHVRLSAIGV